MKRRTATINKISLRSSNRRRQLLKRVHQKVTSRRQNYQIIESTEELVKTR
ncbi:MAG: hypothetical protein ACI9J4_000186 [Paraglaciecola sp.]|jgi:hypothetical protein